MANIKSARKRIAIAQRNNLRNKNYLSNIKSSIKKFQAAVTTYQTNPNPENYNHTIQALSFAFSKIDKAAKINVIHKNKAARKKRSLQRVLTLLT